MGYASKTDFFRANLFRQPVRRGDMVTVRPYAEVEAYYMTRVAQIVAVLDRLRASPLAPWVRVFGSAGRGVHLPGDIDCFVDMREVPAEERQSGSFGLLTIARESSLLDPFKIVARTGEFWVRNAEATNWERVERPRRMLEEIARDGRPLAEVVVAADLGVVEIDPVECAVARMAEWDQRTKAESRRDIRANMMSVDIRAAAAWMAFPGVSEMVEKWQADLEVLRRDTADDDPSAAATARRR